MISDCVQSDRTSERLSLLSAFRELAEKGPEILLPGARSEFSGKYYSESGIGLELELGASLPIQRPSACSS